MKRLRPKIRYNELTNLVENIAEDSFYENLEDEIKVDFDKRQRPKMGHGEFESIVENSFYEILKEGVNVDPNYLKFMAQGIKDNYSANINKASRKEMKETAKNLGEIFAITLELIIRNKELLYRKVA